jgi:hypothetical protein
MSVSFDLNTFSGFSIVDGEFEFRSSPLSVEQKAWIDSFLSFANVVEDAHSQTSKPPSVRARDINLNLVPCEQEQMAPPVAPGQVLADFDANDPENLCSMVTIGELKYLREHYPLPAGYKYMLPQEDERAHRLSRAESVVYTQAIYRGLRAPPTPTLHMLVTRLHAHPGQIPPNGICVLRCTEVLFKLLNVPLTYYVFRHMFSIKLDKARNYTIARKPSCPFELAHTDSNIAGWKSCWVKITSGEGIPAVFPYDFNMHDSSACKGEKLGADDARYYKAFVRRFHAMVKEARDPAAPQDPPTEGEEDGRPKLCSRYLTSRAMITLVKLDHTFDPRVPIPSPSKFFFFFFFFFFVSST